MHTHICDRFNDSHFTVFFPHKTRDIFSYKHFYVVYCKFWELDDDHDMVIDGEDLYKYDHEALTPLIIDRILDGGPRPLAIGKKCNKLSYKDFIWLMLCSEDKKNPASIEYW